MCVCMCLCVCIFLNLTAPVDSCIIFVGNNSDTVILHRFPSTTWKGDN